jgi:hypothetical protein
MAEIYDEIFKEENEVKCNEKKEKRTDEESRKRIYRKKFNSLLNIFCCNKICYKDKGDYVVAPQDAYIIKHIIKYASIETSFIGKWFNGHLSKFNSKDIVEFYEDLETKLKELIKEQKTDIVHVNEWLGAINTIIDYSTSKQIMGITKLLEDFRILSLPLNHHIEVGQIISTDCDGNKDIVLEPNEIPCNADDDSKYFYSAKHYMDALYSKVEKYNKEIEEKSYETVKNLTEMKVAFDASGTADDYLDNDIKEIASPYVLRDYNIQRYLLEKPEIKKKLEKELEIKNISNYYNIIPRENK